MSGKKELQRFSNFCPTTLFNILKKSGFNIPMALLSKIYEKYAFKTIENIVLAKYSKKSLCDFLAELDEDVLNDDKIKMLKDISALVLLVLDDLETKVII